MGLYDRDYMKAGPGRDNENPHQGPSLSKTALIIAAAVILGLLIVLLR